LLFLFYNPPIFFSKKSIYKEKNNRLFGEKEMDWKVILEKDEENYFIVTVPSLPGCISQGKTRKAALKNIKEAIELHVSSLAEDGIPLKGNTETAKVTVKL